MTTLFSANLGCVNLLVQAPPESAAVFDHPAHLSVHQALQTSWLEEERALWEKPSALFVDDALLNHFSSPTENEDGYRHPSVSSSSSNAQFGYFPELDDIPLLPADHLLDHPDSDQNCQPHELRRPPSSRVFSGIQPAVDRFSNQCELIGGRAVDSHHFTSLSARLGEATTVRPALPKMPAIYVGTLADGGGLNSNDFTKDDSGRHSPGFSRRTTSRTRLQTIQEEVLEGAMFRSTSLSHPAVLDLVVDVGSGLPCSLQGNVDHHHLGHMTRKPIWPLGFSHLEYSPPELPSNEDTRIPMGKLVITLHGVAMHHAELPSCASDVPAYESAASAGSDYDDLRLPSSNFVAFDMQPSHEHGVVNSTTCKSTRPSDDCTIMAI